MTSTEDLCFPYLDFPIIPQKFSILSSTRASCCIFVVTLPTPANISNTGQTQQHRPTLATPANISNTGQHQQHWPNLATPANISSTSQPQQHRPTLATPAKLSNTGQHQQHQPTLATPAKLSNTSQPQPTLATTAKLTILILTISIVSFERPACLQPRSADRGVNKILNPCIWATTPADERRKYEVQPRTRAQLQ